MTMTKRKGRREPSSALRELLDYHFPRLKVIDGIPLWPAKYYASGERPLSIQLAHPLSPTARPRADLDAAQRELYARREDLRRCPECGVFFLTAHATREFCYKTPSCRVKFHRYKKKLTVQLRDAQQRRDRAVVSRLRSAIEQHIERARPLKR